MLFTDPIFLFLFLPAVMAVFYFVAPRFGTTGAFMVLTVASLIFYSPWGLQNSLLLFASFTVNFIVSYWLLKLPGSNSWPRWLLHFFGQIYNFGTLFWFKYSAFFSHIFTGGASGGQFSLVSVAVPIGISFYTFQQAMFLLETYRRDPHVIVYMGKLEGVVNTLRAYLRYTVFVVFFPHLVIGPIVYLDEFQPQVDSRQFGRFKRSDIEVGLVFLIIGLFKKMVLADNLAPIADAVFGTAEQGQHISMIAAWLGAMGYYAQLYFDFSGYADMALGTARMFGVRYPMNFYSPLKAVGLIDYYKRWHISLTRVISRFLYTPLSTEGTRYALRNKLSWLPRQFLSVWLPLAINFEIIALWHGARWTFILFGVIHGLWYITETQIRQSKRFKKFVRETSPIWRAYAGRAILLVPMVTTFALFRASSIASFGHMASQMFSGDLFHGSMPVRFERSFATVAASFAVIWLLPNSVEFLRRYRPAIATYENQMYGWRIFNVAWRPTWVMSILMAAMLLAALYYIGRQPPFLYMGF